MNKGKSIIMSDYYTKVISEKFKQRMKEVGTNAESIAKETGISKTKISRIVNKKGVFSIAELHAIAKILNTTIDYFTSYDFNEDSETDLVVPILDISKKGFSEQHIGDIKANDLACKAIVGVYVNKIFASPLLPSSTVLLLDIDRSVNINKPIVFMHDLSLRLGFKKDDYIQDIYDSVMFPQLSCSLLGTIEKQIVFSDKNTSPSKKLITKYAEYIAKFETKYDYLYKLLLSS